jgi:hypothetical protein
MAKLTVLMLAASTSVALAHPSLVSHDHPHAANALAGLDMLLVAAVVVALGLAVFKQVRS